MAEHPNAALIRAGYEAFAAGDMGKVGELLSPDIVWHAPGSNPLSGDQVGVEAVLANFGKLFELTAGTFGQEIHDVVANDDHVVALVTQWWEQPHPHRGGSVHVWHVKDGKATEAWLADLDQATSDAALTP
jgi:ketosteroid isomerase-like protein